MSTLSEAIEQRRREELMAVSSTESKQQPPDTCDLSVKKAPVCLRVENAAGTQWLLPWACFHGAQHGRISASSSDPSPKLPEKLQLLFIHHEIVALGHNLGGLMPVIETMTLRELRQSPEKYDVLTGTSTPVVVQMEVKPV